ncbi:MAG: hypothetical protein NZM26_04645 [Patescibacteria group bacterium]|nr:hypothetical protein [Patescibacteria group bacterium]
MSTDKRLSEADFSGWSQREIELLENVKEIGAKPISPTLAAEMYNLFLEGYSCAYIAKMNKGFSEGDILYCRYKYEWDRQRDDYAKQLTAQVQQKLFKQKLESVEYLTNMLAVIHKEHKETMLRFLQTGNLEDLPKIGSLKTYKDILEALAKVTGEDSVKKLKLEGKVQHDGVIKTEQTAISISPDLQTKLLQALAEGVSQKTSNKDEDES